MTTAAPPRRRTVGERTPANAPPPVEGAPGAETLAAETLGAVSPRVVLWDNANIVESFPELTMPLTFSIAVELYASVYRGLCRTVGVPVATIERERATFEELLGLLQGRVYYNVNNWYRVLSLLPGFGLAAGFLEAMMGASPPGGLAREHAVLVVASPPGRGAETAMSLRLGWRMLRLGGEASRFRARLAAVISDHRRSSTPGPPAGLTSPAAVLAEFEDLRAAALRDWRAPILNDLFLMFVHGALRRTASRWLGPEARPLVNALLADGVVSARSGEALLQLGAAIRERPDWAAVVLDTPTEALLERLAGDPSLAELAARISAYLEVWADRAPRELQLERPTFREDPTPLLRALRPLVGDRAGSPTPAAAGAGRIVRRRLLVGPLGPIRLAVFTLLLRLTRRGVRWREEMRLIRGQVFGVGRWIFRRLGEVLQANGVIEAPGDVHYLTIAELREIVAGRSRRGRARELAAERRAQYAAYAAMPRLPNRLETRGPSIDPLSIVQPAAPDVQAPPRAWRGIGAAVGRVRGSCLVILEPTTAGPASGRIVVARSTDPGWVPILLGALGLAVEQGSLLSHSAIVARELGIPTVVGVPGLVDRVRDGDVLELDGATGEVRLVGRASA
jgi:pyruvate,water dikinase